MALIPEEVMNSPVYIALPIAARHLLTEIAIQFRPAGNNGSLCLAFDAIFEKRGWKRSLFYKSCKQLARSGFIVITRKGGNRLATYCALAWRDIERPMAKVGSYDPHIVLGRPPYKPWIKSVADHPTLSKMLSGTAVSSVAEKCGVTTQHVDREMCSAATRFSHGHTSNVVPGNPLEGVPIESTGCDATLSKILCHGQRDSELVLDQSASLTVMEGQLPSESEAGRVRTAKAQCPTFAPADNVISLSVAWNRQRGPAPESVRHQGRGAMGTEIESLTNEFRELLVAGGITPAATEKRIAETFATYGLEPGARFMREFIAEKGHKIRAERKAARTSGAIAASVRWFKPAERVA